MNRSLLIYCLSSQHRRSLERCFLAVASIAHTSKGTAAFLCCVIQKVHTRRCSHKTSGAERCLVSELPQVWLPCSCFHLCLLFTGEDLGLVHFPKPLHAWTLHPSATPTHKTEECCWAYKLLRGGTSCVGWALPLINFRTDTLSWKRFHCQHHHVDISILEWFQLLHVLLSIFPSSSSSAIALPNCCLSCPKLGGCAVSWRTCWFSPGEQWKCLGTH